MAVPLNILQNVQTYQMSSLAYLQNLYCFIATSNTKFNDFQTFGGQLGSVVTFDLPPRMTTVNSLVASFEGVQQRVQNLTVDQQISTSFAFTNQQLLFNVQDYMQNFGKSAIQEIGAKVESNVAQNCITGTYRFYGDGVTPVNSSQQLASMLALFRTFGSATGMAKAYLQDTVVPGIINSNLAQFAGDRNNMEAKSWMLGEFDMCEWYQSNLLPVHIAGTEGQNDSLLTVVSVTTDATGAVIAITFSGTHAASDPNSIVQYDKFQFQDGVSGFPNIRFRTFIGHEPSAAPVQFAATANAASTSGSQVTVSINPPLQAAPTQNQNITTQIQAGMQVRVLPSHRAGLVYSGDSFYLAMPMLPEQPPYATANMADPESGISVRQTYGSVFGQNTQGMVYDGIWGSTLAQDYGMMIAFPL